MDIFSYELLSEKAILHGISELLSNSDTGDIQLKASESDDT